MHSQYKYIKLSISIMFITCLMTRCKKFIEVEPPTTFITETNVFNNDLTASSVVTGLYSNLSMRGRSSPDIISISKVGGISSDEMDLWTGALEREKAYYRNDLISTGSGGVSTSNYGTELWNVSYPYIYKCNQIIQGIEASNSLTLSIKQQLLGETRFLRAFLYFYLVNLYGDVPLVTGVDPEVNRLLPKTRTSDVYDFLKRELKEAKGQLSADYLNSNLKPTSNAERVRPTKWAAAALLARVHLFAGDFADAEMEASEVINQSNLFQIAGVTLDKVFLKNSKEAIWQLQPTTVGWNTIDARWFVLTNTPVGFSSDKSVYLSQSLYNSFEPGDDRRIVWTGTYNISSPASTYNFPYKYKAGQNVDITATAVGNIAEYHMVLRLSEQYLIRAEARASQSNISGAVTDLNVIRTRARAMPTVDIPDPLPDLATSLSQSEVLNAVLQERRVELFSEWGHRWLDLKRTGKVDAVMEVAAALKGGEWETTDQLYPIPADDISRNPNLKQNPGY